MGLLWQDIVNGQILNAKKKEWTLKKGKHLLNYPVLLSWLLNTVLLIQQGIFNCGQPSKKPRRPVFLMRTLNGRSPKVPEPTKTMILFTKKFVTKVMGLVGLPFSSKPLPITEIVPPPTYVQHLLKTGVTWGKLAVLVGCLNKKAW